MNAHYDIGGGLAQSVERTLRMCKVRGSKPLASSLAFYFTFHDDVSHTLIFAAPVTVAFFDKKLRTAVRSLSQSSRR